MPTFEFILKRDCDAPHCSTRPREDRAREIEFINWSHGYADSEGEDAPRRGILFGNWNNYSRRACDLLERAGYAIEWEDEWTTCADCGKALRTEPHSWGWLPSYVETDDGAVCLECLDIPEYLREIEDNPRKTCFRSIDPAEHGYVLISEPAEYENGFHSGQDDNPEKILAALHARGLRHILFRVPSKGQFEISFETWQATNGDEPQED